MIHSDIIIIGGGAAGLMAAAGAAEVFSAAESHKRVTVLEKMPRPGRKIMITGKGRCNITNTKEWDEFSSHIHPKANPLKHSFYNFNTSDTVRYLERNGLETVVERGDRVFPASHQAADVVDTLVRAARRAGAEIVCGCEVSEIDGRFIVGCQDGSEYGCSRLIIATGGLSYPGTGSTGDGYRWAAQFGHSVRPCFPSLTAIVPEGYKVLQQTQGSSKGHIDRSVPLSDTGSMLNGNLLKNISLSLYIDGRKVQEEFGEMEFTDGGIEGAAGFKVSRKCVNTIINGGKVSISVDLKPAVSRDALDRRIKGLWQEIANDRRSTGKSYEERFRILLGKLMPASLTGGFRRCNQNIDHKSLAGRLKEWKMDIRGYVGYERCVITAGGVSIDEISSKTMESRLCPGLYLAGEVLDLDGDTGGYNLQTAFSTGMLAGQSAAAGILREQ